MKYLMINANCDNRGDEAAVKAMIQSIRKFDRDAEIELYNGGNTYLTNMPNIKQHKGYPISANRISLICFAIMCLTNGKICIKPDDRAFINSIKNADIVLHSPGGPNIGDTYIRIEWIYLFKLNLVRNSKRKYMFYAPSMGPFQKPWNNILRRKVLENAEAVVLREDISLGYVNDFVKTKRILVSADSAFQSEINITHCDNIISRYVELSSYMKCHKKCIGMTITDLIWHPIHGRNAEMADIIRQAFTELIDYLVEQGYGIIFIPQLYGQRNDEIYMTSFAKDNNDCFVMNSSSELYDSEFQQYIISQLYLMIGMRYHSNIFAAKFAVPFVSISYEQKTKGFMKLIDMLDDCIDISELSFDKLKQRVRFIENNYDIYKNKMENIQEIMIKKSRKTTEILEQIVNEA